ncbi:uncharacterized protein F5891DRAFT_1197230 [Suillus fuscotomentosus]|uniref:Uncharacterized protein n=1 Tax=Suillus fuscotomentosus TaxID=1912939 RepID=A0AAD4DU14_9AGAM|nr:uncharacterized protein F5891DRAFT_1197230 [Suillus fuscotomentosus]KAG1891933.1 hypothetical protein F5891DRAFT_1197230 [Suillus fuscotomentosus]
MTHQHLGLNLPGNSNPQATPSSSTLQSNQISTANRPMQPPILPLPPSTQRMGTTVMHARLLELEKEEANGTHPLANAPLIRIPASFADPAAVDRAREAAAAMHNEPKKPTLPELVPGFKANPLDAIIPPKVEDALRQYKYVPYLAITPAARLHAARNGDKAFSFNTQGNLVAKEPWKSISPFTTAPTMGQPSYLIIRLFLSSHPPTDEKLRKNMILHTTQAVARISLATQLIPPHTSTSPLKCSAPGKLLYRATQSLCKKAELWPQLQPQQRADTLSQQPTESTTASIGSALLPARLEPTAPTSMDAASAERLVMELAAAPSEPDPRLVITPLIVDWDFAMVLMLGYKAPHRTLVYFKNHTSSQLDPSFIDLYIASEQATGCYSQGYTPHELELLIGPFQSLPLGLVPKPHSSKFRLVQDLLYP